MLNWFRRIMHRSALQAHADAMREMNYREAGVHLRRAQRWEPKR